MALRAALLGRGRPIPTLPPGQMEAEMLPDAVVMAMLQRELLLTRAKLHALHYEHIMGERKMRTYKSQLKQARRPTARAGSRLAGWRACMLFAAWVLGMWVGHADSSCSTPTAQRAPSAPCLCALACQASRPGRSVGAGRARV